MIQSILTKVFAGVFLGGVIGALVTGDWIYILVWSFSMSAFILLAVFGGIRRGRTADPFSIARVETVTRTGREQDGAQELSVRLTVAPAGESPYQTTTLARVHTDELRTFTPGTIVIVSRLGPQRPDVTIVPVGPDTVTARAQQARTDPSVIPPASSVPAWETATTTTPGTPRPGTRRLPGGAQLAISLTIILVVAAATTIPAWGSISRAAQSVAAGDWDGTNLITGRFQQEAVDAVADVVGGYEFTNIGFYDTYLVVDAPTTPGASTTDTYMYRYGRAWRDGPEFIQPSDLQAELFDGAGLDFGQVGAAAELALEDAALDNADVYASVARDPSGQVDGPVISISISGDYGSRSYVYDFDLNLIRSN
ncbi:hypothetical protein [Schumannella luteola]